MTSAAHRSELVKAVVPGFWLSGWLDPPAAMTPRLQQRIAEHQDRSERLIGWAQLTVVVVFAALFLTAPKEGTGAIYELRPVWVIGGYLAFTLVRLYLSYRQRLPGWLLTLSIVADIALLMLLIWGFHLEFKQPPAFSLKSPTLLYAFIFIALRTLRFEARYVLLAGAAAAAGWIAVVIYTLVWQDGASGQPVITRSYVTYLTSNSVLIGAEIDKIIAILVVTVVLASAIVRARQLLIRGLSEQAAASSFARFFSAEIATQIRESQQDIHAGYGHSREAAILTTDLRGFTQFSATADPNQVMAALIEYQRRLVPIIQRHGGVVDKFLGDGILATFGCAIPSHTFAADAIRAAIDIAGEAEAWACARTSAEQEPLAIGVAVTTGRVIFGAVGDESRLEFTVIGEAVNQAAKLEKHTKVESVRALATASACDLALVQGLKCATPFERRLARSIDGVSLPIDLVKLC